MQKINSVSELYEVISMPGKKKKELDKQQRDYFEYARHHEPKRPIVKNCIHAFLVGGLICAIGQIVSMIFIKYFKFTEETVGSPTSAVLIITSVLLTGFGIYDKIAQWAGAGTAVPITGFANTAASSAIEHRSEGFVLGVGGNMFKIAGPVITYGVVSAFFVAIARLIIKGG